MATTIPRCGNGRARAGATTQLLLRRVAQREVRRINRVGGGGGEEEEAADMSAFFASAFIGIHGFIFFASAPLVVGVTLRVLLHYSCCEGSFTDGLGPHTGDARTMCFKRNGWYSGV